MWIGHRIKHSEINNEFNVFLLHLLSPFTNVLGPVVGKDSIHKVPLFLSCLVKNEPHHRFMSHPQLQNKHSEYISLIISEVKQDNSATINK